MSIERKLNRIIVSGRPAPRDVFWMSSAYYQILGAGFDDVEIDFSRCETLFESFMLPVACLARSYLRDNKLETSITKPSDQNLKALFHNANWEHLLSPSMYPSTTFEGSQHVPAVQFMDSDGHHEAVDRVLNAVLASLPDFNRDSLKALKWSLDEIADNVLNHADSGVGGFLQASTFAQSGCVEFVVADAGLGIPKTLNITNHQRAIEEAIKEGVTRNKETNSGNGLYGAFQVATLSSGHFEVMSGRGHLSATNQSLMFLDVKALFPGTVVISRVNCTEPDLLSRALRFGGQPHNPAFDYIEQQYETDRDNELLFKMKEESKSFGSRVSAKSVFLKIINLLRMNQSAKLIIDFEDVIIISSSFADEVFGKLFIEMGPLTFTNRLEFRNADDTIKGLVDRAIRQRAAY